jgi:hypothetical protein
MLTTVLNSIIKLFITILVVSIFAGTLHYLQNWLVFRYKLNESWYYIRNTGNWLSLVRLNFYSFFFISTLYFLVIFLVKKKIRLTFLKEIIIAEVLTFIFYFTILIITSGLNGMFTSAVNYMFLLFGMLPPVALALVARVLKN